MRQAGSERKTVIRRAQALLLALGFPLGSSGPNRDGVDGEAGDKTVSALKAFQTMVGLAPVGAPDGATLSALEEAAAAGRTVRVLAAEAARRGVELPIDPRSSRAAFVNAVYYAALLDEARTGVPAAVTTAQAVLESNYGQNVPVDARTGEYSHNLFGIKGRGTMGAVVIWADEELGGASVRIEAAFRAYRSFAESIADHSALLTGEARYRPLLAGKDPEAWAFGLRRAGYATDSRYAQKLIGIMRSWGLI